MNFKYWINKWLGCGLWWQILFFAIINFGVFVIGFLLYYYIGFTSDVKLWETLRLFINSNSILENTHEFASNHVMLLFIECLGNIFFSGLIISIITTLILRNVEAIKEGHVHYNIKNHVVIIGYDTIVPSILS